MSSPPTITSVGPASGPLTGGQEVTLNGTNLLRGTQGRTEIMLNGIIVYTTSFTVYQSSQAIKFITPPAIVDGAVDLVVSVALWSNGVLIPGGSATLTDGYTYVAAPTISSVSPASGPLTGSQVVTVVGTNLHSSVTIMLGTFSVTSSSIVVNATKTSLTFITPPATVAGAVDLRLTTPGGQITASQQYTYVDAATWIELLTAPTISSIISNRKTKYVEIRGTNFKKNYTTVMLGSQTPGIMSVKSSTLIQLQRSRFTVGSLYVTVDVDGNRNTSTMLHTFSTVKGTKNEAVKITAVPGKVNITMDLRAGHKAYFVVGSSKMPEFKTTGANTVSYSTGEPGQNLLVKVYFIEIKFSKQPPFVHNLIAKKTITTL